MKTSLKSKLASEGIDVSSFSTLSEVVTQSDKTLTDIGQTEREKQFPVFTLATVLDGTLSLWQHLREIRDKIGYSPVILGDKESLSHHWEIRDDEWSPAAYVKDALDCNAKVWLQQQWDGIFAYDETFHEADIRGDWDEKARPFTKFDLSRLYRKTVPIQYIGLLPTIVNWELPAYLPFGNWNSCPVPSEHVCIHQYWHSMYQTEIIAMLFDTLICRVGNPVGERDAALHLAREYTAYCQDSVFQGTGTLDLLAAGLMNSTYWLFWWD